jgi:hypothetical protein
MFLWFTYKPLIICPFCFARPSGLSAIHGFSARFVVYLQFMDFLPVASVYIKCLMLWLDRTSRIPLLLQFIRILGTFSPFLSLSTLHSLFCRPFLNLSAFHKYITRSYGCSAVHGLRPRCYCLSTVTDVLSVLMSF